MVRKREQEGHDPEEPLDRADDGDGPCNQPLSRCCRLHADREHRDQRQKQDPSGPSEEHRHGVGEADGIADGGDEAGDRKEGHGDRPQRRDGLLAHPYADPLDRPRIGECRSRQ